MKAIRKIVNVKNECLTVSKFDEQWNETLVDVCPGLLVILVESEFVGPSGCKNRHGDVSYGFIDYGSNPDGIPGNTNSSKRALEGWRGTTDDWSTTALGVWRVVEVGESRFWDERPDARYGFCGTKLARVVLERVNER